MVSSTLTNTSASRFSSMIRWLDTRCRHLCGEHPAVMAGRVWRHGRERNEMNGHDMTLMTEMTGMNGIGLEWNGIEWMNDGWMNDGWMNG